MSNVATIYALKCQRPYERDGFNDGVNWLAQQAARFEFYSDALTRAVASVNAKADLVTAPARVYEISVASPVGAAATVWLQMFNAAQGSVTLGTTAPAFQLQIDALETQTVQFMQGRFFSTQISWAVTTAASGGTQAAAGNTPTITVLYK